MKNVKKILGNQSGISLVEITVAAAMSVVISLAVMKTNQTGQKGLAKVTSDLDLRLWQSSELMPNLADGNACAWALTGANPATSPVTLSETTNRTVSEIRRVSRDATGTVNGLDADNDRRLFYHDKPIGSHLVLQSAYQERFQPEGSGSTGSCDLVITVAKRNAGEADKSKGPFGASTRLLRIPMQCRVNGSNQLLSCQSSGGVSDSLWQHAYNATPEYISSDKDVLIGIPVSATAGLAAPLQVSDTSSAEFPGTGSGIRQSIRVEPQNSAIVLGNNTAIYEDSSGCSVISNSSSGNLVEGFKHCDNVVSIGAESPNTMTGQYSVTLGSSDSHVTGNYSAAIGNDTRVTADHAMAIGRGARAANSGSTTLSSSNETTSTTVNQFTANFPGGYKFITTRGAGTQTMYPPATALQNGQAEDNGVFIDNLGRIGVGVDMSMISDAEYPDGKPKLHVNNKVTIDGQIKLGDSGNTCSASNEGAVKYNSTIKQLEFCNGTIWTTSGGGGISCVTRNANASGSGVYTASVNCLSGEFVTGGGGICNGISSARAITTSVPTSNGWRIRCESSAGSDDHEAYAICCRNN